MERKLKHSIVSELEGTILNDVDPFPYFMLVSFEASGLIRFTILLLLWPILQLFYIFGFTQLALRLMVFVTTAGVRESEIEAISRAVLPKFFMDDVDKAAWKMFSSFERRVVVTRCPRIMVENFVKNHLGGEVIGCELNVNKFGVATGFIKGANDDWIVERVKKVFEGEKPDVGLGRATSAQPFLSLCKEHYNSPATVALHHNLNRNPPLKPVIFHDGRLVPRPTPFTSLLIILWIPFGIIIAVARLVIGLSIPLRFIPYIVPICGGKLVVNGRPPSSPNPTTTSGVLYVCTHRTLLDPVVLAVVLGRKIPAVTYSISRLTEIISPIPTVRLSRDRQADAECIQSQLAKGDLVVCPEGTTCREPFLLRFSALFAELTDCIVPVAMNYHVSVFHATTARGWKAMDAVFFMMNPCPKYEVTFLKQLPAEVTCSAGKSPYDVANYVQRILAATLGFECTDYTRKDKYRVLAGNDGNVEGFQVMEGLWEMLGFLLH